MIKVNHCTVKFFSFRYISVYLWSASFLYSFHGFMTKKLHYIEDYCPGGSQFLQIYFTIVHYYNCYLYRASFNNFLKGQRDSHTKGVIIKKGLLSRKNQICPSFFGITFKCNQDLLNSNHSKPFFRYISGVEWMYVNSKKLFLWNHLYNPLIIYRINISWTF